MSDTKTPQNLRATPMTYQVERAPNLTLQRTVLAQNADAMTAEDLKRAAGEAQVDLSGAKTKEAMVAAVQSQVRGAELNLED